MLRAGTVEGPERLVAVLVGVAPVVVLTHVALLEVSTKEGDDDASTFA